MIDEQTIQHLIQKAIEAREYSYSPYSHVKVGAALLTKEEKIFTGCNVENASYGLTICAERTAIFKAVSEGYREFKAIAIVLDDEQLGYPCGACRQVIREFSQDITIIMANTKGEYKISTIEELLPYSFGPEFL